MCFKLFYRYFINFLKRIPNNYRQKKLKIKLKLEVMSIHLNRKKQEIIRNIIDEFSSNEITRIDYTKKLPDV